MQMDSSICGQRILLFKIMGLMILILLCFIIPANCYCNWPSPAYPQGDQSYWYYEAYEFMNCNPPTPPTCGGHTSALAFNQTEDNNTANYWLNNANDLYQMGSYEQAAVSYAKALKLNSSLLDGWLDMGNSLFFLGRYQESLSAYNAVLNLEPKNSGALLGKEEALLAIDRMQRVNTTMK